MLRINQTKISYSIIVFIILFFVAFSLVDYELPGSSKSSYLLSEQDSSKSPTIEEILQKPDNKWELNSKSHIYINWKKPGSPLPHWIRQSVYNDAPAERTFVIELQFAAIEKAEFYITQDQKVLKLVNTSFGQKEKSILQNRERHLHGTDIVIPAHTSYDVYIKTESIGVGILSLSIFNKESYQVYDKFRSILLGAFYGGMLSLILYNLIIFFVTRAFVYLLYILYQTSAVIYHYHYDGLGYVFPINDDFALSTRMLHVSLICIPIFASLFISLYLDLKDSDFRLHKLAKIWVIFGFFCIIATFFGSIGESSLMAISYICISCAALAMVIFRIATNLEANSFLIAWAGALAAVTIAGYSHLGLMPGNVISYNITHVGILWEAIFLSIALGERFNRLSLVQEKLKSVIAGKSSMVELNDIGEAPYNLNFRLVKKEVTIMFVDIVHFSKISTRLGPRRTFLEISSFMDNLSKIVVKNRGTVDRSLGDGALVVFGYEASEEYDHSYDAFLAAVEIQMMASKIDSAHAILPCRIGINRAEVHIGNIGSHRRFDYTVIGEGVNFASRLENSCNPHRILLSDSVKNQLQKIEPPISLNRCYIKQKHQADFVEAFEFDPYEQNSEGLRKLEIRFYEFLNHQPVYPRVQVSSNLEIKLKSHVTDLSVINTSLDGYGAVASSLFGRTAIFQVLIETSDIEINRILGQKSLNKIDIEVRWGRKFGDRFLHGLKIVGLSDEQKGQIFDLLAVPVQNKTAS